MKKKANSIKPGHLDGKRGDWLRRFPLNGCLWHQHLKDIKDDKGNVIRSYVCGLELVSTMEHWWRDKETKRPGLQCEDWDFSSLKDSQHDWQLPWAWEYECLREWQPWSDFERWRKEWRREVDRLRSPSTDWICGKRTLDEAQRAAEFSYGGRLQLWLLRDFAKYFPQTPWARIPIEKRNTLKDEPITGSHPITLEGSLLTLKETDPNVTGFPPIPEKLCSQLNGLRSLRRPDPNSEEEKAVYAEYQRETTEALRRHREWLDAPGRYRDEVVQEITPGQFVGTYIIYIPWYQTDDDLKAGFAAWLRKRERELRGVRRKFSRAGLVKRYADLKQLGAMRLLRVMTAEKAASHTQQITGAPVYKNKGDWYDAKKKADMNLARYFGVA